MLALRTILVYVDLSEASDEAVLQAEMLANNNGSQLRLLRVVSEPAGTLDDTIPSELPPLQEAFEAEARDRLSRVLNEADQERFGTVLSIEMGDPAREIARYARDGAVDLIILGVRPGDDAQEALARDVVAGTPCSVFVVRTRATRPGPSDG